MLELEIEKLAKYYQTILCVEYEVMVSDEEKMINRIAYIDGNKIVLSSYWLDKLKEEDELLVIAIMAHLSFHIYQMEAIKYELLPYNITDIWQKEFGNDLDYIDNPEEFYNQSKEKTANAFASLALKHLSKGICTLTIKNGFDDEDIKIIELANIEFNYAKAIYRNRPKFFSDFFA